MTPTSERFAQDDQTALAVEKAVNRALLAEKKVELYEEKLLAKDDRINFLNLQIETLKQQKADALAANKDRRDAGNIDAERLSDAKVIIGKQDAEIARLRNPGFFASLIDKRTIYGGIAGFGLCKLTNGGTSNPFQLNSLNSYQISAEERAKAAMKLF